MATKIPKPVGPDADDLEGQSGATSTENGAINGAETRTGIDPATLTGGSSGNDTTGDDYVRGDDGTILRNKDGSLKRKRGRKAGTSFGSKSRQAGNSENLASAIESLSSMIGFVHIGLASVSKCPELILDDSESKALAGATAKVMAEFDVTPDPKITAIVGLLTTAGTIYTPRYLIIRERRIKEKAERKGSNVVPITGTIDGGLNGLNPGDFPLGG